MRERSLNASGRRPSPAAPDVRPSREGSLLSVRVQPRSSRNTLAGVHASALKVRVTPPAEGGRATAACLKLLSKTLSVPPSALSVVRGERERDKVILVPGLLPAEVLRRLGPHLADL